jgi:signal transduction histidine kinase
MARVIPSHGETGYLVLSDPCPHPDTEEMPAVDQVNSVISHDLRNPLDVAKAHLQAARETDDPEHFDSVADAHDRMERIISDVLTLTREDDVVDPSEQVSIETAATDAWQSVDTEQAVLDLSDSLPTTTADPDRVRRLFENLFRNSVEHTANASVDSTDQDSVAESAHDDGESEARENKVTITVGSGADGFYVSDDGPGIPPEKQETVFEPGHSTRDGGTGLGLAIVERIAAAHDWDIRLTSADSGGSRFEIRF